MVLQINHRPASLFGRAWIEQRGRTNPVCADDFVNMSADGQLGLGQFDKIANRSVSGVSAWGDCVEGCMQGRLMRNKDESIRPFAVAVGVLQGLGKRRQAAFI